MGQVSLKGLRKSYGAVDVIRGIEESVQILRELANGNIENALTKEYQIPNKCQNQKIKC